MSEDPIQSGARPWVPSARGRIALGLLSGFGAVGISAGLGVIGTFLDVHLPFFDPSALILMAPVIIAPACAGAVLRERDAVAAITAGAVAAPIAATFAIDRACPSNEWAFIGLVGGASVVLVIAGVAAFVERLDGARGQGLESRSARRRRARCCGGDWRARVDHLRSEALRVSLIGSD
jgi:hypothetical protein